MTPRFALEVTQGEAEGVVGSVPRSSPRHLPRRAYGLACASAACLAVEIAQCPYRSRRAYTPIRVRPRVFLRSFLFAMTHRRAVDVVAAETSRCWREQRNMSSSRWTEPEVEKRVAVLVLGFPKGTVGSRIRTSPFGLRAVLGDLFRPVDDHAA
jgi:hypothetical protein